MNFLSLSIFLGGVAVGSGLSGRGGEKKLNLTAARGVRALYYKGPAVALPPTARATSIQRAHTSTRRKLPIPPRRPPPQPDLSSLPFPLPHLSEETRFQMHNMAGMLNKPGRPRRNRVVPPRPLPSPHTTSPSAVAFSFCLNGRVRSSNWVLTFAFIENRVIDALRPLR